MIQFGISEAGEAEYLVNMRNAFCWGYNSFDLSTLPQNEYDHLARLFQQCLDVRAYAPLGYPADEMESSLRDRIARTRELQGRRLPH
jgi:hypothetical protein